MSLTANEIAAFLAAELIGPSVTVERPCPADAPVPGGVLFLQHANPAIMAALNGRSDLLALVTPGLAGQLDLPRIVTDDPRLAFARLLQRYFAPRRPSGVSTNLVSGTSLAGRDDLTIADHVVIGRNVTLGRGVEIRPHAVIADDSAIGAGCLIRAHAVIGEEGFGVAYDGDGVPVRMPQLGRVVLGEEVEIGAHSTIARAALAETRIGDQVKMDDQVYIAHNVQIGPRSLIMAGARILGSARLGGGVRIGPGALIATGVTIGDEAEVGMGAVVLEKVPAGALVVGNPARFLRWRRS